jgi:hypothetical protein
VVPPGPADPAERVRYPDCAEPLAQDLPARRPQHDARSRDGTRDGDAARDFAAKVNVGMVGINVPIPVPIAYYTFGGWKKSGFGDLNQHGPDSIRFYTKTKTVTARWPSGVKEGAEFSIPTMQ